MVNDALQAAATAAAEAAAAAAAACPRQQQQQQQQWGPQGGGLCRLLLLLELSFSVPPFEAVVAAYKHRSSRRQQARLRGRGGGASNAQQQQQRGDSNVGLTREGEGGEREWASGELKGGLMRLCVSPLLLLLFADHLVFKMATRQRIVKADGSPPTDVEKEVDRCLADIEASTQSELRAEVAELTVCAVKPVEVPASGKTALVIFVPFRVYANVVRRIHGRLIQELEKKLKRHVVIVGQRNIVGLDFKRKNLKTRPRSRTLTSVQDAMLDDIVSPSEVVGRRWRVRADGSKLMKTGGGERAKIVMLKKHAKLACHHGGPLVDKELIPQLGSRGVMGDRSELVVRGAIAHPPLRPNEVYVSRRVPLLVYVRRCLKLLRVPYAKVQIRGAGRCVETALYLAQDVVAAFGGRLKYSVVAEEDRRPESSAAAAAGGGAAAATAAAEGGPAPVVVSEMFAAAAAKLAAFESNDCAFLAVAAETGTAHAHEEVWSFDGSGGGPRDAALEAARINLEVNSFVRQRKLSAITIELQRQSTLED
ncbi:hypothetical protein ACSSS7_000538 [Eimeria intestinalis]